MSHSKLFVRVAAVLGALLVGTSVHAVGGAVNATAKEARTLTVCADPDNLPLSSSAGQPPGYDLEIAEEIARSLGAQLKVQWYATEYLARVFRQLVGGGCDFFVGVPTDKRLDAANPQVVFSRPYLAAGFVVVVGPQVTAKTLDDLKGKRIGVQMNTVSDFKVFELGFARGLYHRQKEIFQALETGELEAGVMWGPAFGWLAKNQPAAKLRVLADARSEFAFPMAVAVRKSDPELLAEVDKAIDDLGKSGRRDQILSRYGFPMVFATPVSASSSRDNLAGLTARPEFVASKRRPGGRAVVITVPLQFVVGGVRPAPAEAEPAAPASSAGPVSTEFVVVKGKALYVGYCQKCHGRNFESGGIVPDLRRFEGTEADFISTVKLGRPPTAMPPWGGVFNEDEIKSLWAYVRSARKVD